MKYWSEEQIANRNLFWLLCPVYVSVNTFRYPGQSWYKILNYTCTAMWKWRRSDNVTLTKELQTATCCRKQECKRSSGLESVTEVGAQTASQ